MTSPFAILRSAEVEDYVLGHAGARPADRDSVDRRIVSDVENRRGSIIDSQNQVGGWPTLAINRRSLSLPADPNGDDDRDGYTNLEEWLHMQKLAVEGGGPTTTLSPPAAPTAVRVVTN
jgi:hypothetical protein